jgi:hypothetical protein
MPNGIAGQTSKESKSLCRAERVPWEKLWLHPQHQLPMANYPAWDADKDNDGGIPQFHTQCITSTRIK